MTPQNGVPAPAPVDADDAAGAALPRSAPAAFVRRPVRVDARRVSHTNAAEIAEWLGNGATVLANAVRVPYERGNDRWSILAKPGWYITVELEGAGMVDVLSSAQFAATIKQVQP